MPTFKINIATIEMYSYLKFLKPKPHCNFLFIIKTGEFMRESGEQRTTLFFWVCLK